MLKNINLYDIVGLNTHRFYFCEFDCSQILEKN